MMVITCDLFEELIDFVKQCKAQTLNTFDSDKTTKIHHDN